MPNAELSKEERIQVYATVRESGMTQKISAMAAGYHPAYASRAIEPLVKRKMVKLAVDAVKSVLQGNPVGQALPPKSSDVLHASEIVLDRAYPKVLRSESKSLNVNLDLSPQQLAEIDSIMAAHYSKIAETP